jgi:hypothetical protein
VPVARAPIVGDYLVHDRAGLLQVSDTRTLAVGLHPDHVGASMWRMTSPSGSVCYSSRIMALLRIPLVLVALLGVACHPGPVIGSNPDGPAGGTIAGIVTMEGDSPVEATTGANGGYTIKVPEGTYRLELEVRPGEKVAKQPDETRVNRSDLDPRRDFVISGGRP